MNGVLLCGLKNLVVEERDHETWTAIHDDAGLDRRLYMPSSDYEDELVATLVDASADELGQSRTELLSTLGRSLVPKLLTIYNVHIRPEWSALEVVANFEQLMFNAFTANRFTEFEPPTIRCDLPSEETVSFELEDDRGLCALFDGIIEGIGTHYDDNLLVDHRTCSSDDEACCEFFVTRMEAPQPVSTEAEPLAGTRMVIE